MQASMKRLHRPTLTRIMRDLAKNTFNCETMGDPNAIPAMSQAMSQALMQLLLHNPVYGLDMLRVAYAGKEASISYSVGIDGVTAEDIKDIQPASLMPILMRRVEFKAAAKLPVAWIENMLSAMPGQVMQTGMQPAALSSMLNTAVEKGWISQEGEFVAGKVNFSQGKMLVNGKAF
ncbi:MAG: DUF945 family protein [Burkholderiales bacterium]